MKFYAWIFSLPLVQPLQPSVVQHDDPPPLASAEDKDAAWMQWSEALLHAVAEQDSEAFDSLVDFDAMFDRAAKGVPNRKGFVTEFRKGARSTMSGGEGLFADLSAALGEDGHVDFLRLRGTPTARTALFRVVRASGVNYLEFELERSKNNVIRAFDVYSVGAGERTSELLRRWLLPMAAQADAKLMQKLTATEQALIRHWPKVERITNAAQQGDTDEFVKGVAAIPEELRRDKMLILMRISRFAADDPRYVEAIGDLRQHYPDDPCTRMHSIDWFLLRGDYDKSLSELKHMDVWVGGDPYLEVFRAGILIEAKRWDEASAAARGAITRGLSWVDPYWTLVTVSLRQERFEETLAVLREIDQRFALEWNDLTTNAEYAGFVESPQHEQWLSYLKEKAGKREVDQEQKLWR